MTNMTKLQKKIATILSVGTFAFSMSYAALPAPKADASILGAVIGGIAMSSQVEQIISHYDKTEEGRQELLQKFQNELGINDNADLNARLDTMMANLTEGIAAVDPSIYDKPYLYFINNQQTFNAFCSMGHVMSVNTGAFDKMANEDELAVILGHEMGHGQKNHVAKGLRNSIGPAVLASAAGNNLASVILANALDKQGISKPQEREADSLAFEYLTHTHYNPGACAAVWQRVLEQDGNNAETFAAFLLAGGSDHPSNQSRRDDYAKKLYEYSNKHVQVKDGVVFVNGKEFTMPAPAASMSGAERSYFVAGNLASAYHHGYDKENVTVNNATVMMGPQDIIAATAEDEPAETLAERLQSIK